MKPWINTITAGLLLFFSAVLFYLVPSQIGIIETEKMHMSPAFYPQLVLALLAAVSLIYLIMSIVEAMRNRADTIEEEAVEDEDPFIDKASTRTWVTIAIVLAYVYLFEYLGFFVATPVLLGTMMLHMGNRKIRTILLVVVLTPIIMYLLFERVMVIMLPRGALF
jgi:hypothetical protein